MSDGDTKEVRDEFLGEGGSFVFENGVRRRVANPTVDHPDGNAPRDEAGKRLDLAVATAADQ